LDRSRIRIGVTQAVEEEVEEGLDGMVV